MKMTDFVYNEITGEFETKIRICSLNELPDDTTLYYIEGIPNPFPLWEIKMMYLPDGKRIRKIKERYWIEIKKQ